MSPGVTIGLTLIGLAGTIVVNLVAVSWFFGRRMEKYDAFGERLERAEEHVAEVIILKNELKWFKAELRRLGGIAPNGGRD